MELNHYISLSAPSFIVISSTLRLFSPSPCSPGLPSLFPPLSLAPPHLFSSTQITACVRRRNEKY